MPHPNLVLRNHFYRAGNDELEDQDSGELEYYLGSSKGSCFQGYSSNWGSEYRAARGTGVGQIIFADQSGPDCKSKCKTKGGGYAQQHDSSANCRCYSKASGDNVKWTGSGWTVCKLKLKKKSAGSTTTECAAKAGLFLHDNGSCEACPAGTFMEIHSQNVGEDQSGTLAADVKSETEFGRSLKLKLNLGSVRRRRTCVTCQPSTPGILTVNWINCCDPVMLCVQYRQLHGRNLHGQLQRL